MDLTRRRFMATGAAGLAAAGLPLWTLPAGGREGDAPGAGAPLLVVVMLRGGADGVHLAPPLGDRAYARLRGPLALDSTLPFSQDFGLHPALEPLSPLVSRGELALVHAAGSPHPTRSHFEAQDLMELGATEGSALDGGWMTRALGPAAPGSLLSRVALTSELPLCLRGSGSLAIDDPGRAGLASLPAATRSKLAALYEGEPSDPVSRAGLQALAAAEQLRGAALMRSRRKASLRSRVDLLLALEAAGCGVRACFLETAGWDTHTSQGAVKGSAANRARDLAEGLAHLHASLGSRRELVSVVMTEFGRTLRVNGSGGSDHGHGSIMLVAGPAVRGGVHGEWRGLGDRALYEGRDLPVLSDFRSVLWEVLRAHTGQPPSPDTFPGFSPERLGLFSA